MRILIFHPFLWAHYKGKIYSELHKLITPPNQLLVVHSCISESSRVALGEVDLSIHQYPYQLISEQNFEVTSLWQRLKKAWKIVQKYKPTHINLTGYNDPAFWPIIFYARLFGIKLYLSNESTAADKSNRSWKDVFKKIIIRQFDYFFTYGTKSAQYNISLGAKPEQILVKRNAVDNEAIRKIYDQHLKNSHSGKRNFMFVGRLIDIKNIDGLIRAFQNLQNSEQWGLIIVGEGNEKPRLQELAKNNQNIKFKHGTDWRGVAAHLADCDVFVLPSYSEPWGLVINEAMACEKPVIASAECGATVDLIKEGINGFAFKAQDTLALTQKMQYFVDNPDVIPIFGKASLKIIKNYSPQLVASEMFLAFQR